MTKEDLTRITKEAEELYQKTYFEYNDEEREKNRAAGLLRQGYITGSVAQDKYQADQERKNRK